MYPVEGLVWNGESALNSNWNKILVISPFNNKDDVPPSAEISVQFAPVIDENSILKKKGISIIRLKTAKEINESWKVSRGGSKFTFTPAQPLQKNEEYKIDINSLVNDKAGVKLAKEKTLQFKVAGG